MADSASPSPTGPLLVLGLVFFIWAAPMAFTVDSTASESVRYVKSVHTFPLEPLILIPVVFLILLQLYASYEGSVKLKMPEIIFSGNFFAVGGMVVLLIVLIWMRSLLQDFWLSL